MTDPQWNLFRKIIYWILSDLDGQINLPSCQNLPQTISELYYYAKGLDFEWQLDETIQITSDALKEIFERMEEIHRVAKAIIVNAPSTEDIVKLQKDLQTISNDLKRDDRFKAGVALAGAVANIIGSLERSNR